MVVGAAGTAGAVVRSTRRSERVEVTVVSRFVSANIVDDRYYRLLNRSSWELSTVIWDGTVRKCG